MYQFGKISTDPIVDVVFVHGLAANPLRGPSQSWWHTWTNAAGSCWPLEWLEPQFKAARVLAVSYDSRAIGDNQPDIRDAAQSLLEELFLAGIGDRPLVIVAHSLGGIILKELCWWARELSSDRSHSFLRNIRTIHWLACPFNGCSIAKRFSWLGGSFLPLLTPDSKARMYINKDYLRLVDKLRTLRPAIQWQEKSYIETLPFQWVSPCHLDKMHHCLLCRPVHTYQPGFLIPYHYYI